MIARFFPSRLVQASRALLAFGLLGVGCAGGTETGNPSFTLSYAAHSSDLRVASVQTYDAPYVVQSIWLDLGAVSLDADPACGSAHRVITSIPALGVGDHARGAHNFTSFRGPSDHYCALELPFLETPATDAPSELIGYSLLVTGKLADYSLFRIRTRLAPTLRLVGDAGSFELSKAQPEMLIAFDVAAWLRGIDLESAERFDGVIELSETQNPALLTAFEANFPAGVALYRDAGGGTLGPAPERLAHAE